MSGRSTWANRCAQTWNGAGLEVVIVKPTAPVGAGDARPSATGRRIVAALRGQVTPYPPGGVNHAPVADIAAGHLLAAERGEPGRAYILGHRAGNLDHAAFLRLVAEAAGTPVLQPPRRTASGGSAWTRSRQIRRGPSVSWGCRRVICARHLPKQWRGFERSLG